MTYAALPILRTPRLTLRPLQDTDAEALAQGIGNFDVSKWLAVVPYPYSVSDGLAFVRKVHKTETPFWAICDTDGLQGVISLDGELAYWLARPAWGRGYGFEAAHAAVAHWFDDPGAGLLRSGYFEGNRASGRLLEALGFQFTEQITRYAKSFRQDVVSNQMVLSRARWQGRQGMTLYTPRLTIRPLDARDAEALSALSVPEVARNMATIPVDMSVSAARDYIAASRFRGVPGFRLAIERDGKLIGGIGFGGSPANLAYFLAPDHWGQGIASEALSAFLPEAFDRFPISGIAAERFEDNLVSGAVLRKFGFVETGREMGTSLGRLEPAPLITYALSRDNLKVPL